ncbi:MAG: hypothetical protein M0036_13710 [Desulfobacteraceae bacterium]|nr:hypothetical protein [Desulfobacteraceae bacterium]
MAIANPDKGKIIKAANIFGQPLSIFGVPVDREAIFSNHKGVYNKRVEKRQRGLIVKSTFIKVFLKHDEKIRCLTTGYSPVSLMEQVVTGPFFLCFKRALLIFTDRRILHVPTRFSRQPRAAVSQIAYDDCARLSIKGNALLVQYKNGRQEIFPYLGRKERKKIRTLISAIALSPKDAGQLQGRVHLCPSCTHVLPARTGICPTCKLPFKTAFKTKLRAFLLPGGGYFYAHYPAVGSIIAIAELMLISVFTYKMLGWHHGAGVTISSLAAMAVGFILVKLISAFHSAMMVDECVPEEKDYAVRKI